VYRKNHGAEWGWVTLQGRRFPGMQDKKTWGKAHGRVVKGYEDKLWHYYQWLVSPERK
jgi:hypothetical protein